MALFFSFTMICYVFYHLKCIYLSGKIILRRQLLPLWRLNVCIINRFTESHDFVIYAKYMVVLSRAASTSSTCVIVLFWFFSFNIKKATITSNLISLLRCQSGTGFSVLVTVREANLAPLYAPVDHSLSNDNDYFRGDPLIAQHYCPYPVPEKYQLSVTLHHVSWTLAFGDVVVTAYKSVTRGS